MDISAIRLSFDKYLNNSLSVNFTDVLNGIGILWKTKMGNNQISFNGLVKTSNDAPLTYQAKGNFLGENFDSIIFSFSTDGKTVSIGIDITGNWDLLDEQPTIKITTFTFNIAGIGADGIDQRTSFDLSGFFKIADTDFKGAITYSPGAWTFDIQSQSGKINVGGFITTLLQKNTEPLPGELLTKLNSVDIDLLKCTLGSNLILFETDLSFDIGFSEESLHLKIQRTIDDAGSQANYSIFFELGITEDLFFDLQLYFGAATHFVGDIKSRSASVGLLSMNDLLTKIHASAPALPGFAGMQLSEVSIDLNFTEPEFDLTAKFNNLLVQLKAKKANGWGIAAAIDYNDLSALSSVVTVPKFFKLDDLYIAASTIEPSFEFNFGNGSNRKPITLLKDELQLGCIVQLDPNQEDVIRNIMGLQPSDKINLMLSGGIRLNPFNIDFKIDLGSQANPVTAYTQSGYSFKMSDIEAMGNISDSNFSFTLSAGMQATIGDNIIPMSATVIIGENEIDVAANAEDLPAFNIFDYSIQFKQVAVEIGIGFEGVNPVVGFMGEIMFFGSFDCYIAVLIDSAEPQNCMLAASCSKISGKSIAVFIESLCTHNDSTVLSSLNAFLDKIFIDGTIIRSGMTGSPQTTDDLANLRYPTALLSQLPVNIDANRTKLAKAKDAELWILSDQTYGRLYELSYDGSSYMLRNEANIYIVPGAAVNIGSKSFPQGYRLNGDIHIFDFEAAIDLDFSNDGLSFDGSIKNKIDLLNGNIVLSNYNDPAGDNSDPANTGPVISLSTLTSNPHLFFDGYLNLFNVLQAGAKIIYKDSQFSLDFDSTFFGFQASIHADGDWENFSKASFDVSVTIQSPDFASVGADVSALLQKKASDALSNFTKADQGLTLAEQQVDTINQSITSYNEKIGEHNIAIGSLIDQQNSIHTSDYFWGTGEVDWADYESQILFNRGEIAGLNTLITGANAAMVIANGTLEAAKKLVDTTGDGLDTGLVNLGKALAQVINIGDWFVSIDEAGFSVAVEKLGLPIFSTTFKFTFLGTQHSTTLDFDFTEITNCYEILKNNIINIIGNIFNTSRSSYVQRSTSMQQEIDMTVFDYERANATVNAFKNIISNQENNLGNTHINNNIDTRPLNEVMKSMNRTANHLEHMKQKYESVDHTVFLPLMTQQKNVADLSSGNITRKMGDTSSQLSALYKPISYKPAYYNYEAAVKDENKFTAKDKLDRLETAMQNLLILENAEIGFHTKKMTELKNGIALEKAKLNK